jgi:phosphatidylserine/phosphatidylglycerophosphate/cardiolipin synthase-like enzyme
MKKMKIALLLICLIAIDNIKSQNIATVRTASIGSNVTVRGRITNGSELGNIRYMQDASAGISVYGSNLSTVNRGDSVIANGTLTSYNNLLEINPVTFTVLANGLASPTPTLITPNQLGEPHEGIVVKINNVTFSSAGGSFTGNTNYTITSGAQSCQVRINAASPLVGGIIPSTPVNVVGIGSQFCSSPASGCTTGYQLLLRDANDIINPSSIYLTSQPFPTNITTTGLTVNWTTNIAGSYYIKYGKTPNLELGTLNGTGTSATPSIAITGGSPATIYYAQVYSINGTDTAKSLMRVFCTRSLSSGTIKVYFDRTVDNTVSSGTNAFYNPNIADSLAAYINRAKSTIDVTIYNWDNSPGGLTITNALNAAYLRGVKIRIIYDGTTSQTGLNTINPGIKFTPSPTGSNYTIMHDKFVIIDANNASPNNAIVWTGSTNWTANQLTTDANNVIIFQDQSMAKGYKLEFDEMWGDTSVTSSPNSTLAKFGQFKKDNTPHEYVVNGKRVESYFSPSDGTTSHILSTIATANTDLYFGLLLITRSDLATKIANQITSNSLTSKGILHDTSNASVPYFILKGPMGSNLKINSFSWLFHHKYMIVDQSNISSDPILLTGSHNWSNSGETKNDENIVIVHDATTANLYFQEFTQRWNEQFTGIVEYNKDGSVLVYPNPASGTINFKLESENPKQVTLLDVFGRIVYTSKGNQYSIDVSKLSNGIYNLLITTDVHSYNSRIVVEN